MQNPSETAILGDNQLIKFHYNYLLRLLISGLISHLPSPHDTPFVEAEYNWDRAELKYLNQVNMKQNPLTFTEQDWYFYIKNGQHLKYLRHDGVNDGNISLNTGFQIFFLIEGSRNKKFPKFLPGNAQ